MSSTWQNGNVSKLSGAINARLGPAYKMSPLRTLWVPKRWSFSGTDVPARKAKERDPGTIEMGEDPKLLLTKSLPSLFDANEERKNGVMISSSCGTKKYQAIQAVLHRTLRNDNYKAFFISGLQDPFAYKRQRMAVAGDSSNFIFSQKNGRGREKVLHASESRR